MSVILPWSGPGESVCDEEPVWMPGWFLSDILPAATLE